METNEKWIEELGNSIKRMEGYKDSWMKKIKKSDPELYKMVKEKERRAEEFRKSEDYKRGIIRGKNNNWNKYKFKSQLNSLKKLGKYELGFCMCCSKKVELSWEITTENDFPNFKPFVDKICEDCALLKIDLREGLIEEEEYYKKLDEIRKKGQEIYKEQREKEMAELKTKSKKKNENTN